MQKKNPKVSLEKKKHCEAYWIIYPIILLELSQILSLRHQVITWHSLAQHKIVSMLSVKLKQYNLAALTSGINVSRVQHFSCQSGKLIDH